MKLLLKTLLVFSGLIASMAWGQADYPIKPIRMIVPFPPGGVTDIVTRTVSVKLSAELGQPVVVENRAGASGAIGAELGARAAPDGYTLIMGNISTLGINPITFAKLGYDPVTSFDPISLVAVQPLLITVHPGVPAKNLSELVQLAKSQPGQLNYGTAGSSIHLAVEQFRAASKIDIVVIPYKGGGPATADVLAGQVVMMFGGPSSLAQHVATGRLRALAVTGTKPIAALPNVPTFIESGMTAVDAGSYWGSLAPAGTPHDILTILSAAMVKALQLPDVRQRLIELGYGPLGSTPEEFAANLRSEMAKWAKAVKDAGIRVQ